MALVEKTIAQQEGGAIYVLVRYEDNNDLISYVEWANHSDHPVNVEVIDSRSGTPVIQTTLQPVPLNQVNGSVTLSGGQRFKLEEYNISL